MTKKILLCILDGFGIAPKNEGNAIAIAATPFMDELFNDSPSSKLLTHGAAVGLPDGQMGNSEVGHMTIAAGRILKQDLQLIDDFFHNQFNDSSLINKLTTLGRSNPIHLLAMISDGGVHSHLDHLLHFTNHLGLNNCQVWLHLITDGRDVAPCSARAYINKVKQAIEPFGNVKIATICGRYYAMDRDMRLERTGLYLDALLGKSEMSQLDDFVENNYHNKVTDEFFKPASFGAYGGFKEGDCLVMLNFRSDRVKQISNLIFQAFKPGNFSLSISLIDGINDLYTPLITRARPKNTLGEIISNLGIKQLRIAETEKYPHVTYFFNGGAEDSFPGEERILIASPKVSTYDLMPEMSAKELTSQLCKQIESSKYEFILVNYANADMVGHTGDLEASIKAVETIDECLAKLIPIAKENNFIIIITADHGNAESIIENQQIITSHTKNPVPFLLINYNCGSLNDGTLADVAPTILQIMEVRLPSEFTGRSLINEKI